MTSPTGTTSGLSSLPTELRLMIIEKLLPTWTVTNYRDPADIRLYSRSLARFARILGSINRDFRTSVATVLYHLESHLDTRQQEI